EAMNGTINDPGLFIEQCIEALGGWEALQGVLSLYCELERLSWSADEAPHTLRSDIYRARGGRIRIEDFITTDTRIVTIINGLSGVRQRAQQSGAQLKIVQERPLDVVEVESIKRSVRLYPRNFLAHADEHQYEFRGLQLVEASQVYMIELPVEEITYYFDPSSFQCLSLHDRRSKTVTRYEDYRFTDGVLTPFVERVTEKEENFRLDTIRSIEYNLILEDHLFNLP
ncbi:MAG: hypothetical protein AB1489_35765, partial [Acidobacteriota bacterium]